MSGRMADGTTSSETRYGAFISYSHADTAFARRLHRRLETYRLPRRLVRRTTDGPAPSRRLKPIFRDRDEFAAASDLTEAVREAIAESGFLIVVCSPAAAASEWVDLEIRLFRGLHGDHGILAALHRGEPAEAIPPAMTEGGDGSGHAHQPLAADFRRDADGEHLALLKLVAVLAGVRLDQLVQRDAQRRIRRMGAIGAGSLFGMAAAGVLALAAIEGRIAAEHERARSQSVVDYMLTDLRGKLKGVGRLDALDAVNKGAMGYYRGEDPRKLDTPSQIERAAGLQASGEDDETRGNYQAARFEFDKASQITTELYRARPYDATVIYAHAQSAYWNGYIRWRTGDNKGALKEFQDYNLLAQRLPVNPEGSPNYQVEKANAASNLGMFVLRQSLDVRQARAQFEAAQRIYELAGQRSPRDASVQLAIADGYGWLANVERIAANYDGALADRSLQRKVLMSLLTREPNNFQARAQLVNNNLAVARVVAAEGDFDSALRHLRAALHLAKELQHVDRSRTDISRQVRMIELFEARVWLSMPAQRQPDTTKISAVVGNCHYDSIESHNDEIAAFCKIIRSRIDNLRRTSYTASRNYTGPVGAAGSPMLSERWLINFDKERAWSISK